MKLTSNERATKKLIHFVFVAQLFVIEINLLPIDLYIECTRNNGSHKMISNKHFPINLNEKHKTLHKPQGWKIEIFNECKRIHKSLYPSSMHAIQINY